MFRLPRETDQISPGGPPAVDSRAIAECPDAVDRRWPRGPRGYVPVLLWKDAEKYALKTIAPSLRERVLPLIEARPPGINHETGEPERTLQQQVELNVAGLHEALGTRSPLLLDPAALAPAENAVLSAAAAERLYTAASACSLMFAPVVRLDLHDDEVLVARRHTAGGACIRVSRADLATDLGRRLGRIVSRLGLEPSAIDLILDFGGVAGLDRGERVELQRNVVAALRNLPHLRAWRCVVLTMSALPPMVGIKGSRRFTRLEWQIWNRLCSESHGLARMPTFGDYAIEGAVRRPSADPKHMRNAPPTIRFTYQDKWQIVRGQRADKCPLETQYRDLARRHLIGSSAFQSAEHCDGCARAYACATYIGPAGSRGTWRRHGVLHHLTLVVEQIRELHDV